MPVTAERTEQNSDHRPRSPPPSTEAEADPTAPKTPNSGHHFTPKYDTKNFEIKLLSSTLAPYLPHLHLLFFSRYLLKLLDNSQRHHVQ